MNNPQIKIIIVNLIGSVGVAGVSLTKILYKEMQ